MCLPVLVYAYVILINYTAVNIASARANCKGVGGNVYVVRAAHVPLTQIPARPVPRGTRSHRAPLFWPRSTIARNGRQPHGVHHS